MGEPTPARAKEPEDRGSWGTGSRIAAWVSVLVPVLGLAGTVAVQYVDWAIHQALKSRDEAFQKTPPRQTVQDAIHVAIQEAVAQHASVVHPRGISRDEFQNHVTGVGRLQAEINDRLNRLDDRLTRQEQGLRRLRERAELDALDPQRPLGRVLGEDHQPELLGRGVEELAGLDVHREELLPVDGPEAAALARRDLERRAYPLPLRQALLEVEHLVAVHEGEPPIDHREAGRP